MSNPWNRSANWRREEKDPGAHIRSIVRTILEIVPGGVLRAGKTAFGEGRGWLLSITDGGAGIVDIGDEANFLRFDGDDAPSLRSTSRSRSRRPTRAPAGWSSWTATNHAPNW